jgi:tRNA A-37 threonylcarbamoyl transferase component Bud32/tetratricopeptide (TPR) repeat protein
MAEPSDPTKPIEKELSGRIGKYEILHPLGKGAMGQVYLAHDTKLDRDVALKVMAAQIADDPELKVRFEREAKAVGKMQHPNLVTVFDFDYHTDGSPYIAMEFLKGHDLQKRMRRTPQLTLEEKVGIIVRVLNGLHHAHQAGLVHRDIKPANIFIQEDGSVKIMDFGVARDTAASMTGTGNVVGTADYMSPEQVKGERVDGKSDLFSVGCMLFELAAGRRPFHSDNLMAIFYKITHEEANFDLIPQGADYDALMPLLKKALAKNIATRYQTAYEFAVDLREWLKLHATTASSQNVLEALVDLEAPTHAPVPMTEAPGMPEGATVELAPGRRPGAPRKGTIAPTRTPGKTTVEAGAAATMRPGATRVITAPPVSRLPPRVQPAPKQSVLPWLAMGLALVAVGVAGYLAWKGQQAPPPQVVQAPPVTAPPPTTLATPAPPPVTAAPAPDFGEAGGKAAASVKAAHAAFDAGNYDKAVAAAQAALREDGESEPAKKILAQAMVGQKAADQVRTGDAALGRGDLAAAEAAATEAVRIAPWDNRAVALQRRIADAKAQAQRDASASAAAVRNAQVNAALNEAAAALQGKQYEAAIAAYERALTLDPGNAAAQTGKQAAIGSKSLADAAASGGSHTGGGPVRSFVPGRTEAKAPAGGLVGFEDTAGVQVRAGTQRAELPGSIVFEATPVVPKAGEGFRVAAYLSNQGSQPIPLTAMVVTTTVDGRPFRGPVPPATATVAPGQKGLVYQMMPPQVWKDSTQSWSMEILLTTQRNETYRNTLTWK